MRTRVGSSAGTPSAARETCRFNSDRALHYTAPYCTQLRFLARFGADYAKTPDGTHSARCAKKCEDVA